MSLDVKLPVSCLLSFHSSVYHTGPAHGKIAFAVCNIGMIQLNTE